MNEDILLKVAKIYSDSIIKRLSSICAADAELNLEKQKTNNLSALDSKIQDYQDHHYEKLNDSQ